MEVNVVEFVFDGLHEDFKKYETDKHDQKHILQYIDNHKERLVKILCGANGINIDMNEIKRVDISFEVEKPVDFHTFVIDTENECIVFSLADKIFGRYWSVKFSVKRKQ